MAARIRAAIFVLDLIFDLLFSLPALDLMGPNPTARHRILNPNWLFRLLESTIGAIVVIGRSSGVTEGPTQRSV